MSLKQPDNFMEKDSDNEEYSIEEVLLKRGEVYYLAKWKGFGDNDTLQLEEKLSCCNLISLYEARAQKKRRKVITENRSIITMK